MALRTRPVRSRPGRPTPIATADDGAVGELAKGAREGLVADEDAEEGFGTSATGRGGGGPYGHLDEGVGSALGGGAAQVEHGGVVADAGSCFFPVVVVEGLFAPSELVIEDGPVDRVEGEVAFDH